MIKQFIDSIGANVPLNTTVNIRETSILPGTKKLIQVRFPKSKKKRIRKKWAKQRKNYDWREVPAILAVVGNDVFVSPFTHKLMLKYYSKNRTHDNQT